MASVRAGLIVFLCWAFTLHGATTSEVSFALEEVLAQDQIQGDQCVSLLQRKTGENPISQADEDDLEETDGASLAQLQKLDEEDEDGDDDDDEAPGSIPLGEWCRHGTQLNPGRKRRHKGKDRKCSTGRCIFDVNTNSFVCRCVQDFPYATCKRSKNCCPTELRFLGSYCTRDQVCQLPATKQVDVVKKFREGRREEMDDIIDEIGR